MKKRIFLFLAAAITAANTAMAFAADVNVKYNGTLINFEAAQPLIVDGRTMVPVRGLFDNIGFYIEWDGNTKTATLSSATSTIYASNGKLYGNDIGGNPLNIEADVMPQIINDRLYLPMRAISSCLDNVVVNWNGNTKTVEIFEDLSLYDDSDEGTMTLEQQTYIFNVLKDLLAIRQWAVDNNDACLLRFYGRRVVRGEVLSAADCDYTYVKKYMDDLEQMYVPSSMTAFHQPVTDFLHILNSMITEAEQNRDGKTDDDRLTAKVDEYREAKEKVSQNLGVVWYDFFNSNRVYYEAVFGEYTLDILK
jgi:hypothetical protein